MNSPALLVDSAPDVQVDDREYIRLLGYPRGHELEDRALELAQWTRTWYAAHGRPWVYARQSEQLTIGSRSIDVDGVSFTSDRLRRMLVQADAHGVVLVAVSAGPEIEREAHRSWLEERPDEYFFLEMFGSAVVEHLTTIDRSASVRMGGRRGDGDPAALQSRVSRVGHRGSAGALLAHRRRRDPGHARGDGFRHADAEEIAARRLRRHATYRTRAAFERARALRELLVREVPVPPRACTRAALPPRREVANRGQQITADAVYGLEHESASTLGVRALVDHDGRRRIDRRTVPLRWDDVQQHGASARVSLSGDARAPRRGVSDSRAGRAAGHPGTTGTS